MSNEFNEVTFEEVENLEGTVESGETESSGSGRLVALAVGGTLAAVGLVAAGVKKLKDKKADKPKKPKTKLKLVRVPVEEELDEEEVIDELIETEEETE